MSVFNHVAQYHEYKELKDTVLDCYPQKRKSCELTQFETTEEEVRIL